MAIRLNANTAIFGHINNFNSETISGLFGISPLTSINAAYKVYKLDSDKVIINDKIRRRVQKSDNEIIMRTASVIVGKMIEK